MKAIFLFVGRRKFLMSLLASMLGIFSRPIRALSASKPGEASWALSEEDWRQRLSSQAYKVLREEGTEPPFSSLLNDEKREGVFLCAGCEAPLFSSSKKFNSTHFFAAIHSTYSKQLVGTKIALEGVLIV